MYVRMCSMYICIHVQEMEQKEATSCFASYLVMDLPPVSI